MNEPNIWPTPWASKSKQAQIWELWEQGEKLPIVCLMLLLTCDNTSSLLNWSMTLGLFRLIYFWVYTNNLCNFYKFIKVNYDKIAYKNTIYNGVHL
jgi:hypothetical protein